MNQEIHFSQESQTWIIRLRNDYYTRNTSLSYRHTVRVEEEATEEHEGNDNNWSDAQCHIHIRGYTGQEIANREDNLNCQFHLHCVL